MKLLFLIIENVSKWEIILPGDNWMLPTGLVHLIFPAQFIGKCSSLLPLIPPILSWSNYWIIETFPPPCNPLEMRKCWCWGCIHYVKVSPANKRKSGIEDKTRARQRQENGNPVNSAQIALEHQHYQPDIINIIGTRYHKHYNITRLSII